MSGLEIPLYAAAGRLAGALGLGAAIGIERERRGQPAGIRTHAVVCIGSALMMIVSIKMAQLSPGVDPGRIAAQVVSGIGFLGAGAILKHGTSIRGLTTAACLWGVAGVGLAVGAGFWWESVLGTAFITSAVFFLDKLNRVLTLGESLRTCVVYARDVPGVLGRVEDVLGRYECTIRSLGITKLVKEQRVQIHALVQIPDDTDLETLGRAMGAVEGIEQYEID